MLAEADSMSVDDIVASGRAWGPSRGAGGGVSGFDADGDGKISAEELMAVRDDWATRDCGIEECRRMIDGVDYDGDGLFKGCL
ncbi:uncharacterized protein A4U43_C08F30070 [Asparagus officinalis]|nr:uncharacterized protein A4U43_C08F30070 [Asparagus officinalis]